MKYERIKKAYWVGTGEDLRSIGMPWCGAEQVFVNKDQSANQARYLANVDVPYIKRKAIRCKNDDLFLFEGNYWTLNIIKQEIEHRQWRKDMEKLVADNPGRLVYIYSGQWGSLWGTNYCGYTQDKEKAGQFPIEDAWAHTSHCGLEKLISFKFV